jgi:adenylosuccinate synthase
MEASIVIGLGFGDEGKGVTVNSLVSHLGNAHNTIVVKFSGGAQAAHTVMYDDTKHVFASFGSGTLQGASTYLTEDYLLDPQAMLTEKIVLEEKDITIPTVYVHPLAKIVTPFDIAEGRKDAATKYDGTCGMGIGATMKRNLSPYKLYAKDLFHPKICRKKLYAIADYYEEGWNHHDINMFMEELKHFNILCRDYNILTAYHNIIFEGSQGVMLDMEHGIFPNVTYASTTSKNALKVCDILGIDKITRYYVTRAYQTRHGNGWMSNEGDVKISRNEEETNITGKYQGKFRTGKIDYDLLRYAIDTDMAYKSKANDIATRLVVTCMNQVKEEFKPELLGYMKRESYACSSPEGFVMDDNMEEVI